MVTEIEPVQAPQSERKYLTILFVDIQQSTELVAELDPEEALSLLEPALQVMRDAVRRHGGIVSKELGDGIKALFGAPISNAWHAVMACRAALEIVEGIADAGDPRIRVRCGIHSHYVVTRITQGDYSSVYDATGPAAHLANRLQAAAGPGEVFVSDSCRALCDAMFEFEALPPVMAKGFPQPLAMHRVVRARARSLWQARAARSFAPFGGRSAEMARLHELAYGVGNSWRAATVLGEPGIGKSRFVQEFLDTLPAAEWSVAAISCHPTRGAAAYGALADLLVQLHPSLRDDLMDLPDGAMTVGGQLALHWRAALAAILDRPVGDPDWSGLEQSQRAGLIAEALARLLALAAADRPVAAFIDDVQWMDRQSAEALRQGTQPVGWHRFLLIAASRPGDEAGWLREDRATVIRLQPLSDTSGRAILDDVLGTAPVLSRLKRRILQHTGGVPLFIEEVLRHVAQSGILVQPRGDRELVDAFDALDVPPTLLGAIAERIDRLGARPKALLQAASVIGAQITAELLTAVTGAAAADQAMDLATLEAAGILVATTRADRQNFDFAHDLIREVAYESILAKEREAAHRRVLAVLEAEPGLGTVEVLCHHAQRAGDWERLAHFGQVAARRSVERSAMHDAARYVELAAQALDRLPDSRARDEQAIDLRLEARNSLAPIGRFGAWMAFAGEALARASAIGDTTRELAAQVEQAAAANFHCDPPEAIRYGLMAVAKAQAAGLLHWQFRAEYALAQAYMAAGWYPSAIVYLDRALAHIDAAETEGAPRATLLRYSVLRWMMRAVAHSAMGELPQAERSQRRASELAAWADRPYEQIAASYGHGFVAVHAARYEEAEAVLSHGLGLSETYAVRQFSPVMACQVGKLQLLTGRAEQARSTLQQARFSAEAVGHALSEVRAAAYLAMATALAGDPISALPIAQEAVAAGRRRGFDGVTAEALLVEATVLAMQAGLAMQPGTDGSHVADCITEAEAIAARTQARPLLVAARQLRAWIAERGPRRAMPLPFGSGVAPVA